MPWLGDGEILKGMDTFFPNAVMMQLMLKALDKLDVHDVVDVYFTIILE